MMAGERRRAGWSAWLGVRGRTTLAATAVVAIALVVSGLVAVELQRRDLTSNVEEAALLRADDLAQLLEAGALPSTLAVRRADEAFIQIVDPRGTVVAASPNVEGVPSLAVTQTTGEAVQVQRLDSIEPIDDDPFLIVARGADGAEGIYTVVVGASLEGVGRSAAALGGALLLATPPLVLLVAFTTWLVTGRALRPVEQLRTDVASIGRGDLNRRVEEPPNLDEIGRLARTMNAMLAQLEAAQLRQDRFIADASHELKSPIAAIRSQLEVEAAQARGGERGTVLQSALQEVDRLEALALDLLALQQALERVEDRRPLDLDDLVLREVERLRARAAADFDLSNVSGAQVVSSRRLLGRVVANVLENAVQHAESRVSVALFERDEMAVLTVDDDGSGIPPAEAERVFERFERLDSARSRNDGGTGLGLAIVRETVERHGGRVYVDTEHRRGTRIVIELPRVSEAAVRSRSADSSH